MASFIAILLCGSNSIQTFSLDLRAAAVAEASSDEGIQVKIRKKGTMEVSGHYIPVV